MPNRRNALRAASTSFLGAFLAACLIAGSAGAEPRHGLSAFGELKYSPDFPHFDYVNPEAPKGGDFSSRGTSGQNTFDSLNGFILKGVAAEGLGLTFDSLMTRAFDEPDAVYGLVAKTADIAPDDTSVTFKLRPEARFSDGSTLTAYDVKASFELIKAHGHPAFRFPLRDVVGATVIDDHSIRYDFQGTELRDLPLRVAQLPIFSKAYYDKVDFTQTTLEPPLGSGPYRISDVQLGRSVTYERRKDYWARDLNVNVGRYNFDRVRYDYYRERSVAFEAFKAGGYDLQEEFTSKTWATEYTFPAIKDGRVKLDTTPDNRPSGFQAYFLNSRKPKFQDPRVREAMDLAHDFEWTNKTLFYNAYERTHSIFQNSQMEAPKEPPEGLELKILNELRDQLAPEVFGPGHRPSVTDGSGRDRKALRRASRLLDDAGWRVENGVRKNADGEPLEIEFLLFETGFQRVVSPYVNQLKRLGIDARIRLVDNAQFQARQEKFDFDIVIERYALPNTPGIELREMFGSEQADSIGSRNLAGIKDPVVDALIETVVGAKSREELVAAARALDRVIAHGHYFVPQWFKGVHHLAYWDKFARPAIKPHYARGIVDLWWIDAAKSN